MTDLGASKLYRGLERIKRETELKLREILRYARVSFVLDSQQDGSVDVLSLQHAPEFSRSKLAVPPYHLGIVESADASPAHLRSVGITLCRVLKEFETLPDTDRKQWESEAFDGEGKPLSPVTIYGTSYFHRHGLIWAPETYRTNDSVSQEFLKRLAR